MKTILEKNVGNANCGLTFEQAVIGVLTKKLGDMVTISEKEMRQIQSLTIDYNFEAEKYVISSREKN